jgi:hypothetical protein
MITCMLKGWGRCKLNSLLALTLSAGPAMAANYDESILADFSGTPASPTAISLDAGDNIIKGSAGAGDFDLLQFSIPTDHALSSLTLTAYANPFNAVSFVGLATGASWPAGLDFDVDPAQLLGWNHISSTGSSGVGADLLIDMSAAPFTPGFERPLGSGQYTLLIQDTDNVVDYTLTFNLNSTAPIAGDFNNDGIVDAADLEQWKGDFGVDGGSDVDNDGDSDGADFLLWQRHYIAGAAGSAIPEPGTSSIFIWIALAALGVRRTGRRLSTHHTRLER